MGRKLLAIASAAGFVLALAHGSALATHTKDEAGCVNAMNKNLGKMVKFKGKDFTKCVKDASKGKVANAQTCFDSDPKGKIAKQIAKTLSDEGKKCTMGGGPSGYTSGATVNAAGEGAVEGLVADVFGGAMSISTDKVAGGCQATVAKRLQKIVDNKMKEFVKCKKDLLKAGGDAIDTCVTPSGIAADAKGKIAGAITKLGDDIGKKCPGGIATSLFPGACTGLDGNALRDCLDSLAECRVCLAINEADGLSVDCDAFSGIDCPPPPVIGTHKCTFDNTSEIEIISQALALPPFQAGGAIDISCGGIDEGTGKASCSCTLQEFDPIEIIAIGFVCFTPGSGCDQGEIDCDGGNGLDVTMDSDHNIGACTGNADCEASCETHCSGLGMEYYASGCEGFCIGGDNDGQSCDTDEDCPGGSCPGRDEPNQHDDNCQCDCLGIGGGASAAGALQCNLPVNINVEANSPCGDGDVTIAVGTRCIPLTSESVTSQLHDTNNSGGKDFPNPAFTASGSGIDCNDLAGSITTGLNMVGSVNFFDSTIGDLHTNQAFTCQ